MPDNSTASLAVAPSGTLNRQDQLLFRSRISHFDLNGFNHLSDQTLALNAVHRSRPLHHRIDLRVCHRGKQGAGRNVEQCAGESKAHLQ